MSSLARTTRLVRGVVREVEVFAAPFHTWARGCATCGNDQGGNPASLEKLTLLTMWREILIHSIWSMSGQ
jgi:hypothetical protein